jgi:hypothetical protein
MLTGKDGGKNNNKERIGKVPSCSFQVSGFNLFSRK